MKKSFLFIIIFAALLSDKSFAQPNSIYTIQACQAGTIAFRNGASERIALEDNVREILSDSKLRPVYYVVFTPVDNIALPYVSNKNNKEFTAMIKPAPGVKATELRVDYVVFVKKKLQQITLTKPGANGTAQ